MISCSNNAQIFGVGTIRLSSAKSVLVTGGAGFIGSTIALWIKEIAPDVSVVVLDNLKRRGSELNLPRLKMGGVDFHHGDVRNREDLENAGQFDLLIECSAEPSVGSGYAGGTDYLIQTNLVGTVNCLEVVRRRKAGIIFVSTSRVYPVQGLRSIPLQEADERFEVAPDTSATGISREGISESFPLEGYRSLYGATKLASELLVQEFSAAFDLPSVIFRCGVVAGPRQMGKEDQGFITLWLARHLWKSQLSYKGFGGNGKQVRDILDVRDLASLLVKTMESLDWKRGEIFNIGGGNLRSVSLKELTGLCQLLTGNDIDIRAEPASSEVDVPYYVTDASKAKADFGWEPQFQVRNTLDSILSWLIDSEASVKHHFIS